MTVTAFRNLLALYKEHDEFVVFFVGAFLAMALLKKAVNMAIHVMKARREDEKARLDQTKAVIELLKQAGWTTAEIKQLSAESQNEIVRAIQILANMERQNKIQPKKPQNRRHERFPMQLKAKIFVEAYSRSYKGTICDISEGGMKLQVPTLPDLAADTQLKVILQKIKLEVGGRMAWQGQIQIGSQTTPSTYIGIETDAALGLNNILPNN